MSQYSSGNLSSPLTGSEFIDDEYEPTIEALQTNHSGASAPSYVQAGMNWLDTSGTPWAFKMFDGVDHLPWVQFNASTNKVSYVGASIGPTAARQHTLPDVASDTITLNAASQTLTNKALTAPNLTGSVAIDGNAINAGVKASWVLTAAADKVSYFTGTGTAALTDFTSFGRSFVGAANADAAKVLLGDTGISGNDIDALSSATIDGSDLVPVRDGSDGVAKKVTAQSIADLAATEIPTTFGAVNTYVWAYCGASNQTNIASGGDMSGSTLIPIEFNIAPDQGLPNGTVRALAYTSGSALAGTWRNMSGQIVGAHGVGMFIRTL
jgi:hypothetical protein